MKTLAIIGGGMAGLAAAYAAQQIIPTKDFYSKRILVKHNSGRNSGVIHAEITINRML